MEKIMTGSNRSVESVNTITAKIHETNDYIEKIDEAVASSSPFPDRPIC